MGNYITTYSKIHIDPINPQVELIKLEDIAHALSLMCRANGHFKHFYSVGQHSINCALEAKVRGLSERIQLACLLHDASEAYLSDITRPVKHKLHGYIEFERTMQNTVWKAFSLSDLTPQELEYVGEIDDTILYYEFVALMGEKTSIYVPKLYSTPTFDFKDFRLVEQKFISLAQNQKELVEENTCIGIDGCKGGWICAVFNKEGLTVERFSSLNYVVNKYPGFKSILIDMPVGLQSKSEHIRPDTYARQIIRQRSSTVFPAPCRQAVYAESTADSYLENERVLGKKFTPLTVGIIPKIKEVDTFLQNNEIYKNRIQESHPEVCFAILNKSTVISRKSEIDGIEERIAILQKFLPSLRLHDVLAFSKQHKCNIDDIIDAICLAVTASFVAHYKCRTLPESPMLDETGLLMQMIIPIID